MALFQKRGIWDGGKILHIPITQISPAPSQPRTVFDPEELQSLASSIQEMGILQPLSVRKVDNQWQLVAGERRLRAATMAGLTHVPCLAVAVDGQMASLFTMMENIQRKDLNFLEESRGLRHILETFHLSQEQLAQRLGRSQSSIANQLRLLRLPDSVLLPLAEGGFTGRHARALLRLSDTQQVEEITQRILVDKLTVAQTEQLVAEFLSPVPKKVRQKLRFIPKDIRIFMNTLNRSLKMMQTAGLDARCVQEEGADEYVVTVHIPKGVTKG